jgi:hypothetical protein
MAKRRTSKSLIVAFLFGAPLVFVFGYFLGKNDSNLYFVSKSSDTKNKYCKETYNFCFHYPSAYKLEEKDLTGKGYLHKYDVKLIYQEKRETLDNNRDIRLLVYENSDNLSLGGWYERNYREKYLTVPFVEPLVSTSYSNYPTMLVMDNEAPGVPPSIDTLILNGEHVLALKAISFSNTSEILEYMQILSSFEFN